MTRAHLSPARLRTFLVASACWVASACLLPAPISGAAQSASDPRAPGIVDLIEMPGVSSPRLSPDGTLVLYVRSDADWEKNRTVSHIWMATVGDGPDLRLTAGENGESSPRWSPDGSTIAFVAARGDDETAQIYLLDTRGGEARKLTDHPTAVSSISWTPGSDGLFFLASDDKTDEQKERIEAGDDVYAFDENYQQRHLWRVATADGEARRITEGDYSVNEYRLSRDGAMVAWDKGPSPLFDDNDDGEVWVMNADGTAARQITRNAVPEYGAELSPDNQWVLFRADSNVEGEFYYNDKVYLASAEGGGSGTGAAVGARDPTAYRPAIRDFPYEASQAIWGRDASTILVQANTGARQELFSVNVASARATQITHGDHSVSMGSYRPALDRLAVTVASPTEPGDAWLLDGSGGAMARATTVNADAAERFRLPRVEAIQWSGEDGVAVEGLLYYPLDYVEGERRPLVVQTHGGPASSDRFRFPSSHNYETVLARLGYFVLKPNYRGSTGYGDEFLRNMVGHYFDQAHKDVMAGVDHLIAAGMVDGARMAKMGWSAGGHMTNKIVTYTDRFKAASSGAGAANWVSMYGQSDVRIYRTPWFGTTPWEEGAEIDQYWQDSPLREVWKVATPTLFLVGENDARVPMPQSVEMYRGLRHNGVPTHLYVAPRQGHGWRELRHRLYKANVELDWFERWVMDRSWEWEEAPGDAKTDAEKKVSDS